MCAAVYPKKSSSMTRELVMVYEQGHAMCGCCMPCAPPPGPSGGSLRTGAYITLVPVSAQLELFSLPHDPT